MHKHKITLYSESFLEPSLKYCPKFKDHFFESPTPNFDYSLLHIKSLSDEQNPLKINHIPISCWHFRGPPCIIGVQSHQSEELYHIIKVSWVANFRLDKVEILFIYAISWPWLQEVLVFKAMIRFRSCNYKRLIFILKY
mgnify:CR=1 FL=1